jgi:hypothetical protein
MPKKKAKKATKPGQLPLQPLYRDAEGEIRFRENKFVRYMLNELRDHGIGLNELSNLQFDDDDWDQLMQLIGYSLDGYGDLSQTTPARLARATKKARKLEL